MKESIKKIAGGAKAAAELLKEGKTEDAIAKLAEVAAEAEAAATQAEVSEAAAGEQAQEIEKMKTELQKWADLYVTNDSLAAVLQDMKDAIAGFSGIPGSIAKLTERLETVEKSTEGSRQIQKVEEGDDKDLKPLQKLARRL